MMRKSLMVAALVFSSVVSGVAAASTPPPQARAHAASPVVAERNTIREERWERSDLGALKARFERARRTVDRRELRAVDAELARYLDSELRETRGEVSEATWSTGRRGAGEVRRESRELTRLRAIASELRPLEGRTDRASLARKSGLLAELIELARRDVRSAPVARR
ncbi:hypothetical protein FGE12_16115 [Aggregicoccus sp. 17bor-14]|uniref:hypothetical protein n=1 Tax=Myxococcaceae TaxID=31 RepID=UPI00129CD52E|nr:MULTISPECIES: hypothetical protein [Myxococcaceae]MBF5043927.1 hypothetical protein [Simulacricoccus sp. 17bor-14]MRI89678.1 hypothetical protein [Aggregicoccus sp. 17bor-14]